MPVVPLLCDAQWTSFELRTTLITLLQLNAVTVAKDNFGSTDENLFLLETESEQGTFQLMTGTTF